MLRRVYHTPNFPWARAILVVGGVLVLADGAQAGCGDHTFFSFTPFTQNENSGKPQAVRGHSKAKPEAVLPCGRCPNAPTPEPCHGPSCSGQNNGLPATTTTTITYRESQSTALAAILTASIQPEGAERLFGDDIIAPVSSTDSIFHPPRV
jgi:hypothetical protein